MPKSIWNNNKQIVAVTVDWYKYLTFEILSFVHVCHLTDLQVRQPDLQHQEDTASAEDVFVNKEAVAKLTEGLLAHYLPDLQQSKETLHELT